MHPTAGLQIERGERGTASSSGMLHYGPGRTLLDMEVGVVFNPVFGATAHTDHKTTLDRLEE